MAWPMIFASTLVFEVLASAGFVRVVPAQWLPNLALLWVYVLADRTPQTAARTTDVWLTGSAASAALGYVIDVFQVAPRGLHATIYVIAFVLVRVGTDRLAQAHPLRLFLQLGVATFLVQATLWYTKALMLQFSTLSAFNPWMFVTHACITAGLGIAVFAPMSALFDEGTKEW